MYSGSHGDRHQVLKSCHFQSKTLAINCETECSKWGMIWECETWMWRMSNGTVAFHSTSENNFSNCNLLFCFGARFPEIHHPLYTAFKMASQAEKGLSIKHNVKKNRNENTNTDIRLATQWSGMQFVALQSGREESLPSIGREKNGRTQNRKRAKKKEAFLQSYIRAKRKNRGDSKVNESLGNWF